MCKYVLVLALVAVVSCDVSHLLRNNQARANYQSGAEAHANILRQESDIRPDGSYEWAYDTDNGISAQEQGQVHAIGNGDVATAAQGSFSWTSPEGQPIQISYIADENGYQPQGADLPTPPPIPAAIQKALDWIAAHPQQEQRNNKYNQF